VEVVFGPTSLGLIGCCLGGAPPPPPPAPMEKLRETNVKFIVVKHLTVKKEKKNFPHISGNSEWIGYKVIYEEGLPNT